jgi:phosphoribosylformimino-5-aminoimidazole carboxamide ribonucleotide (ProFAR) isomerase
MATGNNDALVRYVCSKLPCRVGGGVRSATRALELIDAGATHVIVGSSLYRGARAGDPQDSYLNLTFAQELVRAVGNKRIIGAVDSKAGKVVIHGWKTSLPITAVQAVKALEAYCDEFLYTHVDREGLMQGHRHEGDPGRGAGDVAAGDGRRRHHDRGRDPGARPPRHPRRGRDGDLHRPAHGAGAAY